MLDTFPTTGADSRFTQKPLFPWVYSSKELLDLEHEEYYRKNWILVCHISDVKEPGDFIVLDFYRESLVVTRAKNGSLYAMKNHCRHRAARLLDGQGNCKTRIQCPYHGWSYDLNGDLKAIPKEPIFPEAKKECLGLHKLQLEEFNSWVFVKIEGEGPSVAEMWGDYAENLAPYRMEEMVPLAPIKTKIWDANWKIAWDNYLESYHVPVGHPGFNRICEENLDELEVLDRGVSRGTFTVRTKLSKEADEARYQELIGECNQHLPEELRRLWDQYGMAPGLGFDIYPELVDIFQIFPLNENQTMIRYGVYGLPSDDPKLNELRQLNFKIMDQVDNEDKEITLRVQEGMNSKDYTPGPLALEEVGIAQFHDHLRDIIPAIGLEQAPEPGSLRRINEEMKSQDRE
ncbi:aromatic ring-hydroxylating oxygenase subunit alpha [Aestuariispira insulae]|uniref:Phenylpropionate dioxygenase-like ring-hydroxylating dioxygenase large terminal subunit n=1 Tax=Aestuariispira insulae TaxID=1461337 RepID=A0A3D9H5A3_9PROT|nr:aromatic ring-hydroxylating dioxygenase subunit alpha [Aestuariispira insulae]RED44642.1 phenylpropionate dioxygenase-like ring-hydroxylating dioxygenase large terminal subunit [Aestuariispira insulae]